MRVVALAALAGCRIGFDPLASSDASALPDAEFFGWTHIAAGDQTTCGVFRGRGYCWGRGSLGEIGDGAMVDRAAPAPVALPPGTVAALAQGEGHGCAIVDELAYCWGTAATGDGQPSSVVPVRAIVPGPVTSIACGGGFACDVGDGDVYCWGFDPQGALGNGAGGASFVPTRVLLPQPAVGVDAGNDHAMALLADGTVWVWGHNDSGVFGTGSSSPASSDVPVMSGVAGALPALAGWHACAIVGGAARCWGGGTNGELGNGMTTSSSTPVDVIGMASSVTALATGGGVVDIDTSCAAVSDVAWCWGGGSHGQLGHGMTMAGSPVPVQVVGLPPDVVELALGYNHSCSRHRDGSVRCWGRGDLGQLGDGTMSGSPGPVLVQSPSS